MMSIINSISAPIASFAIIAALSSCSLNAQESETRKLQNFEAISLETSGRLEIIQGDEEYLTISAPADMIRRISSEVRDGVLHIGYRGIFGGKTAIPVFKLGMKNVARVLAASSGDIESESIIAEGLKIDALSSGKINVRSLAAKNVNVRISSSGCVDLAGSRISKIDASLDSRGDLTIEGVCGEITLKASSSGGFMGEALKTAAASFVLSSSGGASVWITDHLDASLSGKGNLRYFGEPELGMLSASGSGKIISLGKK